MRRTREKLYSSPHTSHVQNLFNDAVRLQQAGQLDDAISLYRRVLSLKPDHADAQSNLGVALFSQGKPEAAIERYLRALAANPGHAGAHNNLAAALASLGRLDQAIAHYKKVLALAPGNAAAHNDLANVFHAQGRFSEAMFHYDQAVSINPAYGEAHLNRAELKTFRADDADLALLDAVARKPDLPPAKAPYIHFALAKAFADCGDYDRAFEHLRKGNAAKRRQIEYDEPGWERLFESIRRVFEPGLFERFAQIAEHGDPSEVPVFVVGMPRSGSTLIEQILSSHPQVLGAGELENLEKLANSVTNAEGEPLSWPDYVSWLDAAALRRMGQEYVAGLPNLPPGKIRIVDKLPVNFVNVGLIHLILPNAKIIHTMRDPLDTCISCYSRLFTTGQEFSYDLAELGRHYRRYAQLMAHWRAVLPAGSTLEVRYEDVVADLEGQARRMIEYCGLPWDDRCLAFDKNPRFVKTASAAQVRKPIYSGSIGRWRRFETHLEPLLRELGDLARSSIAQSAQ